MKIYPVRKFNVAEAAYSTNLRLKMQEAEGMVRRIAPSRERSLALTKLDEGIVLGKCSHCSRGRDGSRGIIKGGKQNEKRCNAEPRKAAGGGLL